MKYITFLLSLFASINFASAQYKFHVATSVGLLGAVDRNYGFSTNLTVGYEVLKKTRLDIMGHYLSKSDSKNFHTSILITPLIQNNRRLILEPSVGIGVLKNTTNNAIYLIVPIKLAVGYRINERISLGVDSLLPLLYKKDESALLHFGTFVSFRF